MQANPRAGTGVHVERRTKIIATVGPASWDAATLEQLIAAGADVFRLNFSHAGPERQAQTIADIRAAAERVGREVAVLGDLPGPKLRIGELRDDFAELKTGMHVTLTPRERRGRRRDDPGLLAGGDRPARRTSSSTSPTARSGCGSTTPRPMASTARSRWAGPSPRTRG